MYKLLIVDDEYNIRYGLSNGIPWQEYGIEVVDTASDGEDAFEKVERYLPDIVISDVSMDNMNGLDLVNLLKQKYPSIKVIILSGYSDFEFVIRALELKVFTYIVKPITSDELMITIKKLILEIEEEKKLKEKIRLMELEIDKNSSLLTDKFLSDLIHGNVQNTDDLKIRSGFLGVNFNSEYYTCMIVEISEFHEIIRNSGLRVLQSQLFGVRTLLRDALNNYETWPLIGENGSFILLVGSNESENSFKECFSILEKAVSDVNILLNISVSISLGGTCSSIMQISKSYKEALLAQEYNAMSPKSSLISIYDVQSSIGTQYMLHAGKENIINDILISSSDDSLNKFIDELFNNTGSQVLSKNQLRIGIMGFLSAIARKAMEMGIDIYQVYTHELIDPYSVIERYTTKNQIENWLRNIISNIRHEIRNKHNANLRNVIIKAKAYMEEKYTNPFLSLNDVAGHVFLNASYFSRLYKNETGENFVETLTKIRLDKARQFLKDTNEKIATLSENVGYPNVRYFCSVFKKYTGLTPLEYRKSI